MTRSIRHGKRLRQEGAIKRIKASLLKWEEEFINPKVDDDVKRLIKRKLNELKQLLRILN